MRRASCRYNAITQASCRKRAVFIRSKVNEVSWKDKDHSLCVRLSDIERARDWIRWVSNPWTDSELSDRVTLAAIGVRQSQGLRRLPEQPVNPVPLRARCSNDPLERRGYSAQGNWVPMEAVWLGDSIPEQSRARLAKRRSSLKTVVTLERPSFPEDNRTNDKPWREWSRSD